MRNYKWAQIAYDAYCKSSKGRSLVSGALLPPFDGLSVNIKDGWWEAANAVLLRADGDRLDVIEKVEGVPDVV